jgi:hypothetical protein
MVFFDLNDNFLSNKSNICVRIMQMEEAFVLKEYGMESIGHQYPIPYGKQMFLLFFLFFFVFLLFMVLHVFIYFFVCTCFNF